MKRGRGVSAEQIDAELTSVGLPVRPGPAGYDLGGDYRDDGPDRLQRGSGIAGRGHAWAIVHIRGRLAGKTWQDMPYVESVRELRWWLRAYMVGEQPPLPRPGIVWYTRRIHNRFGLSWVWMMKHAKGGESVVANTAPPLRPRTGEETER